MFHGKDGARLSQLFRDSLSDIYENILTLDPAEAFQAPEDYYSVLNDAVETTGE
jgi:hypothetical protein